MSAPQATVVVVRDPDWETEVVVDGCEARTVVLDLGSNFDVSHLSENDRFNVEEFLAWTDEVAAGLPEGSARTKVEQVHDMVAERFAEAVGTTTFDASSIEADPASAQRNGA